MDANCCHICGSQDLVHIPDYEGMHRVTSDCKPWPAGGRLAVCRRCGCAQAITDAAWHAEADRIYRQYTIYHQAQGAEQSVFDQASGFAMARSDRLLERLQKEIPLREDGRLLDIGCGNGALLRAFSRRWPKWRLAGVEVSDQYRDIVEKIPGVEQLFTGSPDAVPGQFDLITLVHVLEHIAGPATFLDRLNEKVAPDGYLMVEVPDCEQNPFMLVVADHATHFFRDRLRAAVASAGYETAAASDDWIAKEITVVGRKRSNRAREEHWPSWPDPVGPVQRRIDWLKSIVEFCRSLQSRGAFGIFGTSIAATWLFSELDGKIAFFIDEDPNRIGQMHLGRPILSPANAPAGSHIFMALPHFLAQAVAARIQQQSRGKCHLPPESK